MAVKIVVNMIILYLIQGDLNKYASTNHTNHGLVMRDMEIQIFVVSTKVMLNSLGILDI